MRGIVGSVLIALCWAGATAARPEQGPARPEKPSSLARWQAALAEGRACHDFSFEDIGGDAPKFSDFKALPERGRPAAPKISKSYDTFRTAIRRGAAAGPSFAGHYTFVAWGVGAGGRCWAIVDALTGDVSNGGLRHEACLTTEGQDAQEPQFKVDSRLLILSGHLGDGRVGVGYYEWTGRSLKMLRFYPWDSLCQGRRTP